MRWARRNSTFSKTKSSSRSSSGGARNWSAPATATALQGVFMVWKGGLGVWGGIFLGTLVGAIVAKRAGKSPFALMDAAAPGLLLAHAIGRIGNWWNQELYGKPTDLPWGLEIA